MKKYIFSAAFILILSGYAAAQSTPVKQATKPQEKAIVKKSTTTKSTDKKTELKQESSSNAKSDSVKLVVPPPVFVNDSAALPKVKNDF